MLCIARRGLCTVNGAGAGAVSDLLLKIAEPTELGVFRAPEPADETRAAPPFIRYLPMD